MFWFRLQGQACKEDAESIFLEPIPDPFSPGLNLFKVVGKTFFDAVQKTFNQCASRGKDRQTDQDEEYPLKDRKEEAKNSQSDEEPADDQNSNLLKFIHHCLCLHITIDGENQAKLNI